jgi:hypothetical protein
MTLVSALGTYNFDVVLSTTADSQMTMTNSGMYGSGLIKTQSTPITPSAANYAFGLFGNDPSGYRYAGAGMFVLNTSLNVSGGEEDTNDNGSINGPLCIKGGSFTSPDDTGRGTASLQVASSCSGTATAYDYAYYTVSSKQLIAISTDSDNPATLVSILEQQDASSPTGGYTSAALKGQSVIELDGVSAAGSTTPAAQIGVVAYDGSGNIAGPSGSGLAGYFTDESVGGTLSQPSYATGTYSLDSTCGLVTFACGRVTVNLSGATYQPVWYVVSTNQAFAVGTEPGVMAGTLQPQTVPSSGFTLANFLGSYLGGTITPTSTNVTNEIDVTSTPPPGGVFDIVYNTSGPGGQATNQDFSGAYDCSTPGQTTCSTTGTDYGRFEITTTSTTGAPVVSILYVVGTSASGITGGKGGLVSINVGKYSDGSADPNPRLSTLTR